MGKYVLDINVRMGGWRSGVGLVCFSPLIIVAAACAWHFLQKGDVMPLVVATLFLVVGGYFLGVMILSMLHSERACLHIDEDQIYWDLGEYSEIIKVGSVLSVTTVSGEAERIYFTLNDGTVKELPSGPFGGRKKVEAAIKQVAPRVHFSKSREGWIEKLL